MHHTSKLCSSSLFPHTVLHKYHGFSAVCMYTYIITILVATHVNREWSSELKYSMQSLRKHLEEECDAYFLKIEKHAVKVPNITKLTMAHLTLQLSHLHTV